MAPRSRKPHLPWDVFVSFRGPDTRSTFVSHLYQRLDDLGIRTFKDKPELHIGEEISEALLRAIKGSEIYVVVLSENYASSPWCLNELEEIFKCYETIEKFKRLVVGVYYHIDPSVARHQTGSFREAFKNHETRFAGLKENKVKNWRLTLTKVAAFSGEHVSADREEADVINEIVDVILRKIKPKTLHVANYPVGLDSRVEDITAQLSNGTEGVIKIGLYGMGGVGKTTLAKALFNHFLERSFEGSCFLAEVREASKRGNGLVYLQQQLIDDILRSKKKVEVHNIEEGTIYIRDRICSTKILVLIDDIDSLKQYQSLVGPFASGSVVIITTRDEEILDSIEVGPRFRYRVNELDSAESLTLFTWHAFADAKPEKTKMLLSEDALRLAGGLPMALQIFGSGLSTKSEKGWKYYIDKLKRNPEITIQQKLMISLDALKSEDPMLKKIFLDIACFFIGWEKEEVVSILDTYYSYADHNIDILKKRCLLTINNRDELRMHDLLRDMGREVARNISPHDTDDAGNYSRLWVSKDACDVLWKQKGTEVIEGIIPNNFYYQNALEEISLDTQTFKRMSNLRFLYLKNLSLGGSFEQIFENLRWLRWDCCPLESLPSDFCPPELGILTLHSSKLRTVWAVNMDPQVFKKLTTLDMSYSLDLTRTPDFSKFPCLKILNLEGCKTLEEVHVSIRSLVLLVSINFGGCVSLKSLPDSICILKALESLNIGGCSKLTGSQTELNAWGLRLWKFPSVIGRLSKLVKLNTDDDYEFFENPSSVSSCSARTRWDVFFSFRGTDTRDTFNDHLFNALDNSCFSKYMDDPDLRNREDILPRAIEESRIHVAVFSENYASSDRCLDELVEILNCSNRVGRTVIPVFYKIDASVVRDQTGSFGEAFRRHQVRFSGEMEKVNNWRVTLKEVAHFRGYHISENRYEADIIKKIVHEIQIYPKILHVAKYPVGLDSRVKHIRSLMRSDTEGVIEIGICGMVGVGKTTLAKALYNQFLLEESFTGSCFLTCAIEDSKRTFRYLESLQQKLIDDVLSSKNNLKVKNVSQGIKLIQDRICLTKVLVFIDNLYDLKQYEALVGPFACGSVVIVTTQDEEILDTIQIEPKYRYRLTELGNVESLTLFTRYAFGFTKPHNNLIELSKEILHHAGGLPLALKVFGSDLAGLHTTVWESYTRRLQRVSNKRIQQRLVISFDALKLDYPMLQDIFLDIACFFIGRKKEDVVKIMESYYSNVDHYINILMKRFLLRINYKNELEIHDLIQDMGREVARNNSPREPGKHSRLWVFEDIFAVLNNHEGTKAIQGIVSSDLNLQEAHEEVSFTTETFKSMSKLRFLSLNDVNITGSFEKTFKDLRWLCWDGCPLRCLPSDFYPQELVILELSHSKLRTIWEPNRVSHVFKQLKTLNMKYSQDLVTTPDFTKLPYLETLDLEGCKSLVEVNKSIGSLPRLLSLNFKYCCNLRSLPDSICNLRELEVLCIVGCSRLKALPKEIRKIESLKELNANELTISKLPDTFGLLSRLVELKLRYNENLETLPDTICIMRSLEILNFGYCRHLLFITEFPPNLKWIRGDGCTSLEKLPNLSNLERLEYFHLAYCSGLTDIQGLEELTSLKELYLGGCHPSLLAYSLTERFFQASEVLDKLTTLDMSYSLDLTTTPDFSKFPCLEILILEGCKSLEEVHVSIGSLSRLVSLNLKYCSNLKMLEFLDVTDCRGLTEIQGLEELTSLRKIHLGGCESSLIANILTRRFFQIYSGFGHEIDIYIQAVEFPYWIEQLPDWNGQSSNLGSTVSMNLPPNVSHNSLALILCFKLGGVVTYGKTTAYSVKNTKSGFIWSGSFDNNHPETQITIVPTSIFPLEDGDERIELTADAEILGILLLYRPEITMIDQSDSPNVNVVEEQSDYPNVNVVEDQSDCPNVNTVEDQSDNPNVNVVEDQSDNPNVNLVEYHSDSPDVNDVEEMLLYRTEITMIDQSDSPDVNVVEERLLYKTEITTDQSDSPNVNVIEDQSDSPNVNVVEERWYPPKWLKLLWVRPFWHKLLMCLHIYFRKKFKSLSYLFWPKWILYWVGRKLAQYIDNRKNRGKE